MLGFSGHSQTCGPGQYALNLASKVASGILASSKSKSVGTKVCKCCGVNVSKLEVPGPTLLKRGLGFRV